MEQIQNKLKIKGRSKKNPFDYSIKKFSEIDDFALSKTNEVKRESNVMKFDYDQLAVATKTFPINRRDERKIPTEANFPCIDKKRKSYVKEKKIDIPLDFSRTITNSSKSKLIQKDEDLNELSFGKYENIVPRLESKEFEEDYERVFTFNKNSKTHKILESLSKTNPFEIENSDHSILIQKRERKSEKPYTNQILFQDSDIESPHSPDMSGLKTGDREEILQCIQKAKHQVPELNHLSFNDTLIQFHSSQQIYTDKEIWITSFKDKILCCKKKVLLSQDFQEHCEKLIIFSYVNFNASNSFHSSLLASVLHNLRTFSCGNSWEEAGFSCDPYENELKHSVANFGLFFVMFIVDFMNGFCKEMMEYCKKHGLAFVSIVLDLGEIAILMLRKRKLNRVIVDCGKCLEIVFFFAAGCLKKWFEIHQEKVKASDIVERVEKSANNNPINLINLGKDSLDIYLNIHEI